MSTAADAFAIEVEVDDCEPCTRHDETGIDDLPIDEHGPPYKVCRIHMLGLTMKLEQAGLNPAIRDAPFLSKR